MKIHIIYSLLIIVGLSGCFTAKPPRLPDKSYQIENTTLALREYWRSHIRISGMPYNPPDLLAGYGYVAYRSNNRTEHFWQIQVLDSTDGNLLWESEKSSHLAEIAIDKERLYAMINFNIHAYDLDNGQHLWESQEFPSHRSYDLHSDGERLCIRSISEKIYYLDISTGIMLGDQPLSVSDKTWLLAQFPQFEIYTSRMAVQAVDNATQEILWTADIGNIGPVKQLPVLFENVLLFSVGSSMFAIDAQTGQIRWRNWYPPDQGVPFASNFIVPDGFLYALDQKARLVQLDAKTGLETGYMQFTPLPANVSENRYWVAADGQMIFVSFEDSQELIALGP